ncbi:TIM barrel protein [Orrella sp. JC864]|uniref:hydroxypyruvate isomerase family protein n=1 Tax=Orrella sp. JC864 TaxID=3120298 RepID=UPI00300BCCBB
MLRFSANLSILFTELPFAERFAAAKAAGFDAVECWFPYEHATAAQVGGLLRDNGLQMVGINTPWGADGQWGLAALPGSEAAFEDSLRRTLDYAQAIGRPAVHVMAGLAGHVPAHEARRAYLANLRKAVRLAEGSGVTLLIEPLNGRDRPGYFLRSVEQAAQVIESQGLDSLRIMFDCYHTQIEEGDVITRLRRHFGKLGHIQIAGVPARGEPDRGELNYTEILRELRQLGWSGHIGAEYKPSGASAQSLAWLHALRQDGIAA